MVIESNFSIFIFVPESCHIDLSCRISVNELTEGNPELTNTLYNLYHAISSSYQDENPNLALSHSGSEEK